MTPTGWTGNWDIYTALRLRLVWSASSSGIRVFSHSAPAPPLAFGVHRGDVMRGATMTMWSDRLRGNPTLKRALKTRSALVAS